MSNLYEMIFKRKSIRRYDKSKRISDAELESINEFFKTVNHLITDINVSLKIVPNSETSCPFGEYALLLYSEVKDNYLLNAGYMMSQMDLFLASLDIGCCWYGFGKVKENEIDIQSFVIMLSIGKCNKEDFRKDVSKISRKDIVVTWQGDYQDIGNIVKYAPSACNSQPWRVIAKEKEINVYRTKNYKSMMNLAIKLKSYYNLIDMGIYLCFLHQTLNQLNYKYETKIHNEDCTNDPILVATIELK